MLRCIELRSHLRALVIGYWKIELAVMMLAAVLALAMVWRVSADALAWSEPEGVEPTSNASRIVPKGAKKVTANGAVPRLTAGPNALDPGVCGRTQQVQDLILSKLDAVDNCADVTDANLASITGTFSLSRQVIARLQSGDFAGLTGVEKIFLDDNFLRTLPSGLFSPVAPNIQQITIRRNGIIDLPTDTFSGMTNLNNLDLRYNELDRLPSSLFAGLTSLSVLNLSGNGMTTIGASDFIGLTSLTVLDLSNNKFATFPGNAFADLSNLTGLRITGTAPDFAAQEPGLGTISANTFTGLSSVTDLELRDMPLTSLPAGIFDPLTSLANVAVIRTNITTLPAGAFAATGDLKVLKLYGNDDMTMLPTDLLADGAMLDEVDLSNTAVTGLPAELLTAMSAAEIIRLPPALSAWPTVDSDDTPPIKVSWELPATLEEFSVEGNDTFTALPDGILETLPSGLDKLTVKELVLSDDVLSAIGGHGPGATGWEKIEFAEIGLTSAKLTELLISWCTPDLGANVDPTPENCGNTKWDGPNEFIVTGDDLSGWFASSLDTSVLARQKAAVSVVHSAVLRLRDNMVTATEMDTLLLNLPSSLAAFKTSGNNLSGLSADLSRFGNTNQFDSLRNLSIQDSQLGDGGLLHILDNFPAQLRTLDLRGNGIATVPAFPASASNLATLRIQGDQISSLTAGVFNQLTSLRTLSLIGNQLTTFPENLLDSSPSLRVLQLDDNQLAMLPEDLFEDSTDLHTILMVNNPIGNVDPSYFQGLSKMYTLHFGTRKPTSGELAKYRAAGIMPGLSALQMAGVNQAPTVNELMDANGDATRDLPENSAEGTDVGSPLSATDPEEGVLYYLTVGNLSPFTINEANGQLLAGPAENYDFEDDAKNAYAVTVTVTDEHGSSSEINVKVVITNVDEAGTVALSTAAPKQGIGVTASLSDPDGGVTGTAWQWASSTDGNDWTGIGGATSGSYTPVAGDVGKQLRATASYTDDEGSGKSASAQTGAVGSNSAPAFSGETATRSVDEGSSGGTNVGAAVTATDGDSDTLTYTLGGTDAAAFAIGGTTGQITVGSGATLDYETKTSYSVTVTATDPSMATDSVVVTINVNNVDEAGTVALSTAAPKQGIGVTASLSDPDGGVTGTAWQWASSTDGNDWTGIGGATSGSYTPVAGDVGKQLRATASYTDDEGSGKSASAQTGAVGSNSAPAFSGETATRSVDEGSSGGTNVGAAVTATDGDSDTLTYTLGGTDAAAFAIGGTTGQITVGSGATLDYETKTSYSVTVTATDPSMATDSVVVTINVNNVDEAGTVALSTAAPKQGIGVTASLSDPDGGVTGTAWQWASSTDGNDWTGIGGATSGSYTPVAGDVGKQLRATASYTDDEGSGKSASAQTGAVGSNSAPAFSGETATRSVDEGSSGGTNVGAAVTATDGDSDTLTYTLGGTDAAAFAIGGTTGQITVGSGATLDYETKTSYSVTVTATDPSMATDSVVVTINVNNVDEAGTVALSTAAPKQGIGVTASLSDPDGGVTGTAWQWASSTDGNDWTGIGGATSGSYTPVAGDVGKQLRATASYTDDEGSGKSASAQTGAVGSNSAPAFSGETATRSVDEGSSGGTNVGAAVTATDGDSDTLTYTLGGTDAAAFAIGGTTGQITVGSGATLDYETKTSYSVTVTATDPSMATDSVVVTINVNNVDEAGTVALSTAAPKQGIGVTASLSDPDGGVTGTAWQWASSTDGNDWTGIAGPRRGVTRRWLGTWASSCVPRPATPTTRALGRARRRRPAMSNIR